MIAKFLANRWFMLFLTFVTLLLLFFLVFERVETVLLTHNLNAYESLLEDGETIAILLVGLGVVLESRETLLRKSRQGEEDKSEEKAQWEHDLEYYGVLILVLGLLIEMGAQVIRFINVRFGLEGAPPPAIAVMHGFGMIALFVLIRIVWLLLLPNLGTKHKQN
ncbi:MAG: hypothetical protein ACKVTZ_24275 [Bacteroidia bacterium]